jgi:hypothetical protein
MLEPTVRSARADRRPEGERRSGQISAGEAREIGGGEAGDESRHEAEPRARAGDEAAE